LLCLRALRGGLTVAALCVLPRLRGLLALRALLMPGPPALRGIARLVPVFLPILLRMVAALAMMLLAGCLPTALMALLPVRFLPGRRCVVRRSGLETGDGPLLDAPVDQALDRGEKRTVLAAHQRHRLAR
jgi:hypothetical protein